ncbi:UNVERIFIED_CONTAM: hypothetical protein HDU68_003973 [Siphonaria sp. JEL0065]|nr:hypothetical protein HDU68_003973 [Siphonaria sp. JEL0065]
MSDQTEKETYHPKSGRGRKQTTAEAASRRAAQNREAQRTLRERKQKYITSLEDKIKELTALVAPNDLYSEYERLKKRVVDLEAEASVAVGSISDPISSNNQTVIITECSNCPLERLKCALLNDKVASLEHRIAVLEKENVALQNPATDSFGLTATYFDPMMLDFGNTDGWLDSLMKDLEQPPELLKSAEELYGPMEVESCGIALKGIASIKASHMDIVDKLGALHLMYMMQMAFKAPVNALRPPLATTLPPEALRLKETALNIPSLKDSQDLVHEICCVYWNDSNMHKETLLYLNLLSYKLQKIIVEAEDMEKWMVAFEIAKSANGDRMEKMLIEAMKALEIDQ